MIKQLKAFTVNMVAGANLATVVIMLLLGFSDYVNPVRFPVLSVSGMLFPVFLLLNMGFFVFWLVFKWRKLWIPLLGYALAYVPINIYMPLNRAAEVPDGTIKFISYNVCCYGGAFKYDDGFGPIFDYLAQQQADIVCLQEDVDSWRGNVFDKYSPYYAYNDTAVFFDHRGTMNGVGIHTRFPIVRKERIPYESIGNGSVAWYLLVEGDTVLVINNHLEGTHLSTEDRLRYKDLLRGRMERDTAKAESALLLSKLAWAVARRGPQADVVHRYVKEHSQYPVIVCGDFNDNPISYSRRVIAKGLTDCFRATGCGLGLSYNQKGFPVRIDHIFCSRHFEPYNCQVDEKIDASDHYPIVCRLKMSDIR